MRKVLSSNQEVAHYFANSVQSEGKASNYYFETDRDGIARLFSYGRHFCVARRINAGLFVMTTRTYGNSTSKHLAYARSALNNRTVVYCVHPEFGAATNKREAQQAMNAAMDEAETKRRIQQKTRDAHKARALYLAEQFNAYLAALPENERECEPFDLSGLADVRAALVAMKAQEEENARRKKEAAQVAAREYLAAWRTDPTVQTIGMSRLPPALRLVARTDTKSPNMHIIHSVIQTSHGAEIPVTDAQALWPALLSVMRKERTPEEAARLVRRLGVYTLNTIRADGSIVVGCHDIAFNEMARMAVSLDLLTQYRVAVRGTYSGRAEVLIMNTWPNMDVEQEAARLAASYGAQVESISPVMTSEEVAA